MSLIRFSLILLILFLGLGYSRVQAVDALNLIRTGVSVLDTALNETASLGSRPQSQANVIREISTLFGLTDSVISSLQRRGYNFGEIYYLGLLHRQTGLPVETILSRKNQGIGWGELAHRLGVHPSELNKTRVALKKAYKSGKSSADTHGAGVPSSPSKEKKYKPHKNKAEKGEHGKGKGKKK